MEHIKDVKKSFKTILYQIGSGIAIVCAIIFMMLLVDSIDTVDNIVSNELGTNLFQYEGKFANIYMRENGLLEVEYTGKDNCVVFVQNTTKENSVKYKYVMKDIEELKELLSEGNGTYEIELCNVIVNENGVGEISGNTEKVKIEIKDTDEKLFTTAGTNSVPELDIIKSTEFVNMTIDEIYKYFCDFEYDKMLANAVENGTVTEHKVDLNLVIENKKGVCIDIATAMVSVLRSKNIPCKLVYGYMNNSYHSWVEIFNEDEEWVLYDPTNNKTSYDNDMSNYFKTEYH